MVNSELNSSLTSEKRLDLTIQTIQASQIPNIRVIVQLYNVSYGILYYKLKGRSTRQDAQINNRKLTITEEKTLLQHVKSLDNNGFSPTLPFIQKMTNQLLRKRLPTGSIG
jgi:hypothetical protein